MCTARVLIVVVLAALWAPSATAGEAEDRVAARQAENARGALAEGDCEGALRAAEAALVAVPEFSQALLLKADAYECAGERDQAALFLEAALEGGSADVVAAAAAELARLDAASQRVRYMASRTHAPHASADPITLRSDPAPLQARVTEALAAGRCASARGAAEELRRLDPDAAVGWGLLGDALVCSGRKRDAVLAYRGWAARGGDDADRLAAMDELAGGLAVVEVRVFGASAEAPSLCRLFVGDEPAAPSSHDPASATFADLPLGTSLRLEIAAQRLKPVTRIIHSLRPGELRIVEVTPEYAGFGSVVAADYDAEDVGALSVESGGETIPLAPGATQRVTAGTVFVIVERDGARTRVDRFVGVDTTVPIDPTPLRPGSLTLSRVPAGAFVRVRVTGHEDVVVERAAEVPPQVGEIDTTTGLRLGVPQRFEGLIGGAMTVSVEHPRLGAWVEETALEPGGALELAVDVGSIPGVPGITAAWRAWKARYDAARSQPIGEPAGPAIGAVLMMVGGGALAVGSYLQSEDRARLALHCEVLDSPAYAQADNDTRRDTCLGRVRAESLQNGLAMGSAVAVGVGIGFVGVSIALGRRGPPVQAPTDAWDPWTTQAPSPSDGPPTDGDDR